MADYKDRWTTVDVAIDDGVAWVTLNRPEKRNAMSPTLNREMIDVLETLELDADAEVVVLTGAGESWSAGMDLKEYFRETDGQPEIAQERIRRDCSQWQWKLLRFYSKPTIAALNGWCFGVAFSPLVAWADFIKVASDGYVAMVQHYFASAWLLGDGVEREHFARRLPDTNPALYSVGMITAVGTLTPGQSKALETRLFVGPQAEKVLEQVAPSLELVKDYGWLTMLAKPLYWLLEKIHGFVANWGWAIVLLVVLLKAAFYWLHAMAYRSMAKMKAINPRITEMRERLKDNPQQMQMEMMKIYREEKVNPMGGCFPIMIQIPVFHTPMQMHLVLLPLQIPLMASMRMGPGLYI